MRAVLGSRFVLSFGFFLSFGSGTRSGGGLDDAVEDLFDIQAGFCGDADDFFFGAAKKVHDFTLCSVDVGGREVDFVDDGDDS